MYVCTVQETLIIVATRMEGCGGRDGGKGTRKNLTINTFTILTSPSRYKGLVWTEGKGRNFITAIELFCLSFYLSLSFYSLLLLFTTSTVLSFELFPS